MKLFDSNLPENITNPIDSVSPKAKTVSAISLGQYTSNDIITKPKHTPEWLLKLCKDNKKSYHNYSHSRTTTILF